MPLASPAAEVLQQAAPWSVLTWTVVAAAAVVYPAWLLRRYIRLMMEKLDDHTPPVEAPASDALPPGATPISFPAADGHPLHGHLFPSATPRDPAGMVIFCHEFGSDGASAIRYCEPLLRRGFDVLTFDYRGHGESAPEAGYRPRQFPTDREVWDTLGAIRFARLHLERSGRPAEVGLFGLSRGGAAAVLAAVESPGVRAVVTDGLFSSDSTIEYLFKRFATVFAKIRVIAENHPPAFWRFMRWMFLSEWERRHKCTFPSTKRALDRLGDRPLLMIHGERDCLVRLEQVRSLYEATPGPKSLWIVEGARHNQALRVAPAQYARRVTQFFETHLGDPIANGAACAATPRPRAVRKPSRQRTNRPAKAMAGAA